MTQVVILDDGVSFFTNPIHLQKVYGRFWDEGIPTCVAITPALKANVHAPQDQAQYYGGIPLAKRGEASPFIVSENKKLCSYLNVMAEQRLVEVCVRGYYGNIDEFNSDDDVLLQQKIEEGQSALRSALPNADINCFVVPEIHYSETATQLLQEYDFNICLPTEAQQYNTEKTLLNNERYQFSYPIQSPSLIINTAIPFTSFDLIILRQSYWMFFDETLQTTNTRFDMWQNLVSHILAIPNLEIDTFAFL